MDKKIIAVALVLVLMVTAFVGCGKKYETTKINGMEFVLVTDAEGNTIIDEDNRVAIHPTDRNGNIPKDENGEPQTNWIPLPETKIKRTGCSFGLGKGWIYDDIIDGYVKEGQEKNISVTVGEFKNEYSSFDEYMKETEKQSQEYIDQIKKAFPKTEISITDGVATTRNLPCKIIETKIVDSEDRVFHYGYVVQFQYKTNVLVVEYACQNYTYEKADSLDVLELINTSLVFEEETK